MRKKKRGEGGLIGYPKFPLSVKQTNKQNKDNLKEEQLSKKI